jgi:hypothetical protein
MLSQATAKRPSLLKHALYASVLFGLARIDSVLTRSAPFNQRQHVAGIRGLNNPCRRNAVYRDVMAAT